MPNTQPFVLTRSEWDEIGAMKTIRKAWGVAPGEDFATFAKDNIYAAKFHFIAGSPGYCGDLFILQGDALTEDAPVMLTRKNGKLVWRN